MRTLLIAVGLSGVGGALAVYALPAFIMLYGGMLPTIVAYLTDERPGRHLTLTVGALNLAGLVLVMRPLLASALSMEAGIALVLDTASWLTVYSFALVGWLLVWLMPVFVAFLLDIVDRQHARTLETAREAIARKWSTIAARNGDMRAEPLGFGDDESEDERPPN